MLCPAKNQFENNEYEILDGTTEYKKLGHLSNVLH